MKKKINGICKNITALISALFLLFSMGLPVLASESPDYVIDASNGAKTPIPTTYVVKRVITDLGKTGGSLSDPQDIFIDNKDRIYIADSGNNRIVKLNASFEFEAAYDNNGGFSSPKGVFADDTGDIFVADTGNQVIVHLNSDGTLSEVFKKPESDLLGDDDSFNVTKLGLSPQGYLYTISSRQLMAIDAHNEFKGYVGTNEVGFDLTRLLIRLFASKQQKESIIDVEMEPYNNFLIADDGMIYAVAAANSSQIQKINAVGRNIYPGGYVTETVTDEDGNYESPSFADIAVDKNGIITVLEQKKGMLYQYDREGNMLTAFGGIGNKKGKFVLPSSIAVNSEGELLVLDAGTGYIHVMEPTYFMREIIAGVTLYADGDYEKACEKWENVVSVDVNYPLANSGIAKALYKLGKTDEAMKYYSLAKDRAGMGTVFSDQRYGFFQRHFFSVVIILALSAAGIILLIGFLKKRSDKILRQYYYEHKPVGGIKMALLAVFHPIDFFDVVKRERSQKFPVLRVVCLYLLSFLANYSYVFIANFRLSAKEPTDANVFLELAMATVPLLSWTVASFAVSSIMNGESKLSEIAYAVAYCQVPSIVFTPLLALVSNLLSTSESGIYQSLRGFVVVWMIALLFLGLKRLNDYGFWKNVLVAVLSLLAMAIMWAIIVLVFALIIQLLNFIESVRQEINLKFFIN